MWYFLVSVILRVSLWRRDGIFLKPILFLVVNIWKIICFSRTLPMLYRRTERSLQGEYFLKEKGVIELSSILKLRNFGIHEDDGNSTASI